MSGWRQWALLGISFVGPLVISAFVVDALHDDTETSAAGQPSEMAANEIEMLAPVFATPVGSIGDDGRIAVNAVPELLDDEPVAQPTGMLVVLPPEELWDSPAEADVAEDFAELIDRAPLEIIDENEDGADPDPAPLALNRRLFTPAAIRGIVGLSDSNRSRFIDPCALLADGCIFGLPAVVALQARTVDFRIDLQLFAGRPQHDLALCPLQYNARPDRFHVSIRTSVPAAIHVEYLKQGLSPVVAELNFALPASDEIGRERWQRSVDDGTFDLDDPSTWVQRCMELDVDSDSSYVFEPVSATAEDGRVVGLEWIATLDTSNAPGTNSRPAMTVTPTSDNHVQVEVWSRNPASGYQTVAIAIPQDGSQQQSCTSYEASFVGLSRDFVIDESHTIYFEPPPPLEPNDWQWRHKIGLSLREGTRYTVCAWEVTRGDRTFDSVQILNRDQVEVTTPNRHRVAVSVDKIRLGQTTKPQFVVVDAGQNCDIYGPRLPLSGGGLAIGGTLVSSGTTVIDDQFCATDGSAPRRAIYARVSVGDELFDRVHAIVALAFDVNSGCELGGPDPRCSNSFSHLFDYDGTALCEGTCDSLRLLFRLDYLPSNGAGTQRWQVGDTASFVPSSVIDPDLPQVDLDAWTFRSNPGTFDATTTFVLNHAADYDITLISGKAGCERHVTGSGEGSVTVVIEDLCPDSYYQIASISLTDASGSSNEQYPRGGRIRDSIYTYGRAAYFDVFVRLDSVIDESQATARCRAIDQPGWGITDRCWDHLAVSYDSQIELGGDLAERKRRQAVCANDPTNAALVSAPSEAARNGPTVVVHGDLVEVSGSLVVRVSVACGGRGGDFAVFAMQNFSFEVSQAALAQPVHLPIEADGLIWDFELVRTDRGVAPGDG